MEEARKPRKPRIGAAWIVIPSVIILTWPLPLWLYGQTELGILKIFVITITVVCLFSYLLLRVMNSEAQKAKRLNTVVIKVVIIVDTIIFTSIFFYPLYDWLSPDGVLVMGVFGWSKTHLISYVISHETKAVSLSLIICLIIIFLISYLIIKGLIKYTRYRNEYIR